MSLEVVIMSSDFTIKVGFRSCGYAKWLYQIVGIFLDLKINKYNFLFLSSFSIIFKLIEILIWLQFKFFI